MRLQSAEILRAFVGPENTKKISGRKLARAIGCHPSFIDHLLMGRRRSCTPVVAQRISEVLEVPLEVLFMPEIPLNKRHDHSHHEGTERRPGTGRTRERVPA